MCKYNPSTYIKDIIDLVRNPPGDVNYALEITPENIDQLKSDLHPSAIPYLQIGDYVVEFEKRDDFCSIMPQAEFKKDYFFTYGTPEPTDVLAMHVLRYPIPTK